jgi:hypothetical protein
MDEIYGIANGPYLYSKVINTIKLNDLMWSLTIVWYVTYV